LAVDREAMRRNVEISREEMLTEAIVVRLTLKGLPRHEAHRLMVELARSKKPDTSLSDLVLKHEILSKYLTPKEVSETLDPVKYLGNYSELIYRALEYAENVLRCQTH
ncbi:MAG: adenylosuccinate lyase, partial [Sulfolobales archaeon]|nr:adenylosuccinate lyase [Sulfolobales archaeon]